MPVLLAHNPRTATNATIQRASVAARAAMNRFDRETLAQLQAIYQQAGHEIQAQINAFAGADGSLHLNSLNALKGQVDQVLTNLDQASMNLLNDGLGQAAGLGVNPFETILDSTAMTRISTDAVNFVHNFVASDGLQLSDRIWRVNNHAKQIVGNAIESAIIQGHGASQAVNNLLANGLPVPADLQSKLNAANAVGVGRASVAELMTGAGSPRANALRLFRTEMNRAHGEAYMMGGQDHEDFGGWKFLLSPRHPEADECDMHARVNRYGLGDGVYPTRKACPWPAHPNTLSYVEIVFKDEITADDKAGKENRIDWLNGQISRIQHGVLNSRGKQGMLQAGLLKENQILTPWEVLKNKLIKQGIDPATMIVRPTGISESGFDVSEVRDAAYKHVLLRGIRKGNSIEYMSVYDMNTGVQKFDFTSLQKSKVSGFSNDHYRLFRDPANRLEIVHNHPSSSSLSPADVQFTASLPGVRYITAIGHNGAIYRASIINGVSRKKLIAANARIESIIVPSLREFVRNGKLSPINAGRLDSQITNLVLDRLNLIEYSTTNLSDELLESINIFTDDFNGYLDNLVNIVSRGI